MRRTRSQNKDLVEVIHSLIQNGLNWNQIATRTGKPKRFCQEQYKYYRRTEPNSEWPVPEPQYHTRHHDRDLVRAARRNAQGEPLTHVAEEMGCSAKNLGDSIDRNRRRRPELYKGIPNLREIRRDLKNKSFQKALKEMKHKGISQKEAARRARMSLARFRSLLKKRSKLQREKTGRELESLRKANRIRKLIQKDMKWHQIESRLGMTRKHAQNVYKHHRHKEGNKRSDWPMPGRKPRGYKYPNTRVVSWARRIAMGTPTGDIARKEGMNTTALRWVIRLRRSHEPGLFKGIPTWRGACRQIKQRQLKEAKALIRKRWTQREAAEEIGIHVTTLSNWLKEDRETRAKRR